MIVRPWLIGIACLLIAELGSYFVETPSDDEVHPWIRWLRHNDLGRWIGKGIAVAVMGISFDYWIFSVLMPAIETGGPKLGYTIFMGLFSLGFGLSIGKHLTNKDYSAFSTGED